MANIISSFKFLTTLNNVHKCIKLIVQYVLHNCYILPFWYWLTLVFLEKKPFNGCSSGGGGRGGGTSSGSNWLGVATAGDQPVTSS